MALDSLRVPAPLTVRPVFYDGDGAPLPADIDAVEALVAQCDIDAVGTRDGGRDEIVSMLTGAASDRELSALVHDGDALAAYVWIEHDPTAAETWVDAYVAASAPCVDAILDAALAHGLAVARADKAAAGADRWTLRSGCFGSDASLLAALGRAGFACVRRFFRMRIDLGSAALPAYAPPLPDGVTVVVARTEDERRRLWGVQQAAFVDHWNHTGRSYEELMARLEEQASDDADGWWLLEVDDVPAAVCILDESRADLGDGYVRTLGVAREFRGRGLAQLLLARAFVRYRDLGRAGVQLSVDSDSPTGAVRLYQRVGMTVAREIDAWELQV